MRGDVTIGDFSRMTHLSVKTLRHYHRVGLLEPAAVDTRSGYRYYRTDQVATAQVIRRFRQLDMPLDEVRAVLAAPNEAARHALIADHLDRLQHQLAHTQSAVASLRSLLEAPTAGGAIERRLVPATTALAVTGSVGLHELGAWWSDGFDHLRSLVAADGETVTGPAGGLYANELFEEEQGEVTLFVPVADPPDRVGRARRLEVPGGFYAVALHPGSHDDADRTYGAVGSYVVDHGLDRPGPVREWYLVDRHDTSDTDAWRTEIGWPIATATAETTAGR